MVARTLGRGAGAGLIRRVCLVGSAPERALLRSALSLAVLLAVPGGQLRTPHPSAYRRMVESLAGVPRALGTARLPRHLLLLPSRLLPIVLLVAAGLRCPRRCHPLYR